MNDGLDMNNRAGGWNWNGCCLVSWVIRRVIVMWMSKCCSHWRHILDDCVEINDGLRDNDEDEA